MSSPSLEDIFEHTGDPAWLLSHGLFVAEGRHVVRRLLDTPGFVVRGILLTPTAEAAMADVVGRVAQAERVAQVLVMSQQEMDDLTGFRLHQGCVAVAERRPMTTLDDVSSPSGVSIALERVRDPDNVGSIIRTASALGVETVFVGSECADPFYRKAIRTSMGAVLTTTLVDATPWPSALEKLAERGYRIVSTTPDEAGVPLDDAARTVEGPVLLLLGSEGEGLTPVARGHASVEARIPMTGPTDSLNVAVAAAIAVYAFTRRTVR